MTVPTVIINAYDLMWYDVDISLDDTRPFFLRMTLLNIYVIYEPKDGLFMFIQVLWVKKLKESNLIVWLLN